jgi:uncharacterized Ntn-hydrolase superfamily protein
MTFTAGSAQATYSMVAVDTATGLAGAVGTSCIGGDDVYVIYGAVPGGGSVAAQATLNRGARDRAVELLQEGVAPSSILDEITSFDFDGNSGIRQYAVVDVSGRVAGFTGDQTRDFAGDVQGQFDGFVYSVQGNLLTGPEVLTQAASAFERMGCDLPERLLLAVEGGAANGNGDRRCTDQGIPSDSAFLQVEAPGMPLGGYLSLRVPTSGGESPLPALRQQFGAWRLENPCPEGPTNTGGGSSTPPAASSHPGCGCRASQGRGLSSFAVWGWFALAVFRRKRRGAGAAQGGPGPACPATAKQGLSPWAPARPEPGRLGRAP